MNQTYVVPSSTSTVVPWPSQ